MKKIAVLLITIAFALFSCACGASQSSSAGLPELTGSAEIKYPQYLPSGLAQSSAYKEAAAYPCVIITHNEDSSHVVTSQRNVRIFWRRLQAGASCELRCYDFYTMENNGSTEYNAICTVFGNPGDGGKSYFYSMQTVGNKSWNAAWDKPGESTDLESLRLADWGSLVYHVSEGYGDIGLQVVNPEDIYPGYQDYQDSYMKYLSPILWDVVSGTTFKDPSEITHWASIYEDLYQYYDPDKNGGDIWAKHPDANFPVSEMAAYIQQYFNVSEDTIRAEIKNSSAPGYDAASDTVHYEGGRGGGMPSVRITGYRKYVVGSEIRAQITYELGQVDTGEPIGRYAMSISLLSDGSYRYLSIQQTK